MTTYWSAFLLGFCVCGLFMGTVAFLAVRSAPAGAPNRIPWRLKNWARRGKR